MAGNRIQSSYMSDRVADNLHAPALAAMPEYFYPSNQTVGPPIVGLISGRDLPVTEDTWFPMPAGTVIYRRQALGFGTFIARSPSGMRTELHDNEIRFGSIVETPSPVVPVREAKIRASKNTAPILLDMGMISNSEASSLLTATAPTWSGAATEVGKGIKTYALAMIVVAVVVAGIWFVPKDILRG